MPSLFPGVAAEIRRAIELNLKDPVDVGSEKIKGGTTMTRGEKTILGSRQKRPAENIPEKKLAGKPARTAGGNPASEKRPDDSKAAPPVQPIAERFPAMEEQQIELTFYAPEARVVQLAGTFNDWSPEKTPLEPTGSGAWVARLKLKSGQYEYRFVVDGVWTNDPEAPQSAPNPYGQSNSVLKVELDDRTDLL
jgi:Glycogen recognition site of AMP-activated protein kinase